MSNNLSTLEAFMKKYIENKAASQGADTLDMYKHKTGANLNDRTFAKAVESLYSTASKSKANYGRNYQELVNKGLHNSGYANYIDALSRDNFYKSLAKLTGERNLANTKTLSDYADYLNKYEKEQNTIKKNVSSHLISKGVVNLDDAVAYGLTQGLSREDAIAIGQNVYSVNKQKVFNDILSQVATLGLDKEGAVLLAKKMGITDSDAKIFGEEIADMLKYYANISDGYLEYLEQKSN